MRSATTASCATALRRISTTPSRVLAELEKSGISLDAITAELVKDGVKLFADAADKLYGAVAHKRAAVLGGGIDQQKLCARRRARQGGRNEHARNGAPRRKIRRLWQHDKSVWTGDRRRQMAGLAGQRRAKADIADYEDFAQRVKGQKFHRRRRARHGRIEPRAGSAGGNLRAEARLPETARAGLHRSGAGPRDGEPRSISPTRCSSSPANPAAPPSRT